MCKICGTKLEPLDVYTGRIRDGVWGKFVDGSVLSCPNCEARWLSIASAVDYTDGYREYVGEDPNRFNELHDHEQPDRLAFLYERGITVRGASVLDVGCAAGSFLDHIASLAGETAGIEPAERYHAQHRPIYRHLDEMPVTHRLHHDLAVSFLTIEHVSNPVQFLHNIRRMLKPGGKLVVSTPNTGEHVIAFPKYQRYFYRVQHPWYFNARSLAECAYRAGFQRVYIETRGKRPEADLAQWGMNDDQLPPNKGVTGTCDDGMYLYMVAE